MSWRDAAYCRGASPRVFYDNVFPDEGGLDPIALVEAQEVCRACVVRRACGVSILEEEQGLPPDERQGVVAFMTPAQRESVIRRGTLRCKCGHVRDTMDLVEGRLHCPNCGIDRAVPGIPAVGDQWKRRHTTLARKVVAWLHDNTVTGDTVPRASHLAQAMSVRIHDMLRVYEALTADGTLIAGNGKHPRYVRSERAAAAARDWQPAHLVTE